MPSARLYHEPGVGARTGMRVKDGAFDLEDFMEAGRRAMNHGYSGTILDSDKDSDDESVGTARQAQTVDTLASSSMIIVDSPGPSPRSTLRQSQAPSSSPFLSSPGTPRYHAPSPLPRFTSKSPFHNQAVGESSKSNDNMSTSSPSKERAKKRRPLTTGLQARKEKKEPEQQSIGVVKQLPMSSSPHRVAGEDESKSEEDETDVSDEVAYKAGGSHDEEGSGAESDISEAYNDNAADLQEFQSQHSEGLEAVSISPRPLTLAAKKGGQERPKVAALGKRKKGDSVLQEKNGIATQSQQSALAKARKRAEEGKSRTRKASREKDDFTGQRAVVEKVPSSLHRQAVVEDAEGQDEGLRRGSRYRYKPLEYWRGEKARFGRPSLPKVTHENVGDETIDGDAFEDHFAGSIPPVAVLKEIIRVPREEGEGTFSGMKIRRERTVEAGKPAAPKKLRVHGQQSLGELDPTQPTRHAESGWDDSTEMKMKVWDAESKSEADLSVACTSSQVRPRLAVNSTFGFEKMFVVDHTMASGVLFILIDGHKPLKSSKENNYTFVVLEGAVRVRLHKSNFVIAPHGMFFVPAGNEYSIENISKRTAKVAFTQCRSRSG